MFDNIALVFGGAVGVTSPTGTGTINVRNSTLNRNRATGPDGYGGAVGLTQGNINVYDSVFNNNSATTYGGAVGVPLTGKFYADMSVFNGNVAGTYGGAIGSAAGVNITYCNFTSNRAGTDGGAVAATGSSDVNNSILSCQFEYNFAGRLGYAIYAANNLTANYNRFFNNTDASGSLRNTIATNEALSYPTVNIDFNWWGDNIPCAGNITPNNWVTVNVDCDNPIIAGGYANYTYTIRLAGDPSSFTGWNASRLPPFMGKGVFTTPPGIPVQEFDAHADITISVPYDASNRYQTGYFQVDNWFSSFTIDTRIKPNVTINAPTGRYKDNVTLTATYTDSIGNPIQGLVVNFYVGGVLVGTNTTDVNGYVTCRYTVASAGNLLYAAYYTGNHPLWGPINATQMLTFTKLPTTTTVTSVNDPIIVATRNNITATVLDFYGAPVVGFMVDFYVNGTYLGSNRTNAQGIAFYSFMANDDPNSQYNFTAIFNETGNFTSSRGDIIDTTARKMDTSIVISQVTTKPFRDARIAITLLNEFGDPISGGTITGTIDSTPFVAITGANGVAYVYHTSLAAGNYIIIANYAGNYMYEASNENGILVVELLNTTVQFKNFIVKVLENATFIAILVDEDGRLLDSKSVDIFVDGNFIGTFTTDSKGQIFVNLGVLPKGEYPITAIYAGDYIVWTGCNVNGTLEVRPINTTVPISVEQDTNVSTTFKARLFDEFRKPLADKPLLFFLNGDFIGVAVTDANGIATLAYAYTPKGKITVEYLGDEIYRESMNNRAFGPYTIPFDQSNPNATNITKQNITIKNNTNKNDSEIDPNNEANNDLNKNPNKDNRNPAVAMLKTGNPFVMVLLCLLSIFFIGFNRRSKK